MCVASISRELMALVLDGRSVVRFKEFSRQARGRPIIRFRLTGSYERRSRGLKQRFWNRFSTSVELCNELRRVERERILANEQ